MKRLIGLLSLALAMIGCDTIERAQYRIEPRITAQGTRVALNNADLDMVKAVLQLFAAEFKMQDISHQSLIPTAFALYQQYDTSTPMKLVAWTQDNSVIVDLAHNSSEPGESAIYSKAKDQLLADLRRQFGGRVAIVPYKHEAEQRHRIAPEHSVTVTPSS